MCNIGNLTSMLNNVGDSFLTILHCLKNIIHSFQSSARRFSQFVQFFKPVLGKTLTVKGYRAKPSTTSKPNEI